MKVIFKNDAVQNIHFILKREWIEKNINGCFAAQSVPGINTRRFHGLLSFLPKGYNEPVNILANMEESLKINDFSYYFSTSQYKEHISPNGYKFMSEFRSSPYPQYIYNIKNIMIQKDLMILPDQNTLIIHYKFLQYNNNRLKLILKPYFTFKNIFELKKSHVEMATDAYEEDNIVNYRPYNDLGIYFSVTDGEYIPSPLWYYNFWHIFDNPVSSDEDYFNPGFFEVNIGQKLDYYFAISDKKISFEEAEILFNEEKKRREKIFINNDKKIFIEKELSVQLNKYVEKINDEIYFKNSPLASKIDLNSFFTIFPFLLQKEENTDFALSSYFALKKLLTKNFLPDNYKFSTKTKLFETPLPNLFFITSTYFGLIAKPFLVPKLIDREFFEELLQGIIKNKYLRLKLDHKGWLNYIKGESEYYWHYPLGLQSIPCKIKIDEVFLNLLWYNSVCVFAELTKSDKTFFLKKILKFKKNLKKQLATELISSESGECCLLRDVLILTLPFSPCAESEKAKLNIRIKENLTPFGLKVVCKDENSPIELALPVGLYLYLFHLLNTMDIIKFKKILDHYLVTGINHLYDGTIMNYTEAFQIRNGKYRKFGDNYSGINLVLFDFWYKKKNEIEEKIKSDAEARIPDA